MTDNSLLDIYQSFGCGIDRKYFQQCLENIDLKDRDKMYRAAQRFWFTTKLRHEASFWANPYVPRHKEASVIFSEIPTLEIYLLCTCLDTLAGKSHMEFDTWLELQNASSGKQFGVAQIIELYRKYKDEYGIGKNIKKLFINLPLAVKLWLSNHVIIRLENDQSPLAPINADDLVILLYRFYFEIWRNAYTHSSISRKVNTIGGMDEIKGKPEWIIGLPSPIRFSSKSSKLWNIYYKSDSVDLSIILRMVVYSASLHVLGIESTEELIENYLLNLHKTRHLYGILYEFRESFNLLDFWTKIRVRVDPLSALPYIMDALNIYVSYGVPTLASTSLDGLLVILDQSDTLEKELYEILSEHHRRINEFNTLIVSFRMANRSKSDLSDDEKIQLRNRIYEFLRKITAMPIFLKLRNFQLPTSTISLLLRDTCVKIIFP